VNKDLLSALRWLDEAEASFVVPGFDDAFDSHGEKLVSSTNSVYLPRRKRPDLPLVHPRQINLVGLKRLDGGTYGDCKRPVPPVK
jgi:hypothetical protein